MTTILDVPRTGVRRLQIVAAVLAIITVYKFVAIALTVVLAEGWKPQLLPWGFLVVFGGSFVATTLMIRRFPRSGALLLAAASAVLGTLVVLYLVQEGLWPGPGADPHVAEGFLLDIPVLYVGGPLAVAAVVLAVRFLAGRSGRRRAA
jgi:hypothetical protein